MRYFIEIAYNGKAYCGWQVQPNKVTVQSTLEEAVNTLLSESMRITGCGRTDSGVHASQFFAHFETEKKLPPQFTYRINKMLPKDIHIKRLITDIPEEAHARFDATYRAYDYYMHFEKDPFNYELSCFFPWLPLNREAMHQVAAMLLEYGDFPMLCKTGGSSKTTLCTMFESEIFFDDTAKTMRYRVAANRFLRGMVRRIMGLLVMVGKEKISVAEMREVMDTKGTFSYNLSVPAHGLYLSEVRYPYLRSITLRH